MQLNDEIICEGKVIDIRYSKDDFYIFAISTTIDNKKQTTNVTGNALSLEIGDKVSIKGKCVNHKTYGLQIKADVIDKHLPTNKNAIIEYLSKNIFNIGDKKAKDIVNHFGEDTIDILDHQPHRLNEIDGIGEKTITSLIISWVEQKEKRDAMLKLSTLGLDSKHLVKIMRHFGENDAFESVKQNPYILMEILDNFKFLRADKVASSLGLPLDSPLRTKAAINYVISTREYQGNCAVPFGTLFYELNELGVDIQNNFNEVLQSMAQEKDIVVYPSCIYSQRTHFAESYVANYIKQSLLVPQTYKLLLVDEIDGIHPLTDHQKEKMQIILDNNVSILTGKAGCGKTMVTRYVIQSLINSNKRFGLVAPTGRAAKRLSEATQCNAKTIHRFLEFNPCENSYSYNESNKYNIDCLIIDECSMVDIQLMCTLLKAIPMGTKLIFIGDPNQLLSVGPGKILSDFIETNIIPTATLTEVIRQGSNSMILDLANGINEGETFSVNDFDDSDDVMFIPANSDVEIIQHINKVICRDAVSRGYDPMNDVQLLTPMRKTSVGVEVLNPHIQSLLNGEMYDVVKHLRVGDKVMQIKNDYNKFVYNGDIGFVMQIDNAEKTVIIRYDGSNDIEYEFGELDDVVLAYAATIHKSQGSEFPVVVIPLTMSHRVMLQRNLMYTAVTRGKQMVYLVGDIKALNTAASTVSLDFRVSFLKDRILGNI